MIYKLKKTLEDGKSTILWWSRDCEVKDMWDYIGLGHISVKEIINQEKRVWVGFEIQKKTNCFD